MPVATRTDDSRHTIIEDDEPRISLPQLDMSLFEEIKDLMTKGRQYREEEDRAKKKIEKYNEAIEAAESMLSKGEAKKDALGKRREKLLKCLQKIDEKEKAKNQ